MSLSEELVRIATAAARHGEVAGVVAVEPVGGSRAYVVGFGGAERAWLVLDGEGEPVTRREAVRAAASMAALCEVAEETAGGGQLDELRRQLVQLRLTESPPGIEEAEEAALALERTIGAPPRVASPAYLDAVGAAVRTLEQALGSTGGSAFAEAMTSSVGTVDAFADEVEARYLLGLEAR